MPEQAPWIPKINDIVHELASLAQIQPLVGSARLQVLLGVGAREAQKILEGLVTERKGKAGFAPVESVIEKLQELAGIADPEKEKERRQRLGRWLIKAEEKHKVSPRCPISVPARMVSAVTGSDLDTIPGLELSPGKIVLSFSSPQEARLKLIALAMAMGRDQEGFDERTKRQ